MSSTNISTTRYNAFHYFFSSVVVASPLGQVTLQFLAVHNLHVRIQVLPGSGAQGSGQSALPAALGAGDEQSASSETPPTHAQLPGERTPKQAVGDEAERSLAELVDASGGGETRESHEMRRVELALCLQPPMTSTDPREASEGSSGLSPSSAGSVSEPAGGSLSTCRGEIRTLGFREIHTDGAKATCFFSFTCTSFF